MITAWLGAAVLVLAQPRAPEPTPAPTLSDAQKASLQRALGTTLAEKTLELRPSDACPFAVSIAGNPKRRDRGVRLTVRPTDPEAEMPVEARFAFVRLHVDAYEKKIKKGPDDLLEFFPFRGDAFGEEGEVVVPYDRFLEVARPIDRNLYFMGIDGERGSPCILDIAAMKSLREFHETLR